MSRRVFAVSHTGQPNKVFFFGFGNLVGDEVPPPDIKFAGRAVKRPNPKIVLDSGKVVWGCECWHGPENRWVEFRGRKTVIDVDIDDMRERAKRSDSQNDFSPED